MHGSRLPLIPFLLCAGVVASAQSPSLPKLRADLESARKRNFVPGMSVVVVKDGQVVLTEGFGLRDVAKRLPVTADTAFEIGSSTKAFTALLVAQAAADGKLSLTDRPSKYLPAFRLKDPDANEKITVGLMMSHTSGLPRMDLGWYSNAFNRDELLNLVAGAEPTAKLGQKWQYQNLMFLFSGMIAERVYGQSYEDLIRTRYFQPLGMKNSSVTYREFLDTPNRAIGYDPRGEETSRLPLGVHNIDVCAPAGAVGSTARDMGNYLRMLLANGEFGGQRLFSESAILETRKPHAPMGAPNMMYGYGWMLRPFEGKTLVEHGGNIDGFNAEVALVPEDHLGVVVLTNVSASPLAMEAAQLALKAYLPPAKAAEVKPAVKLTAADEIPDSYLGEYRLEIANVDLRFFRESGKMFLEQSGQKVPLVLVGPRKYLADVGPKPTFTFEPDPKDPKLGVLKLDQGGMKFTLTRKAPYRAPMTGEELLKKAVDARGGAEALRRHRSMLLRFTTVMKSENLSTNGLRYLTGERTADFELIYGLGRRVGYSQSFTEPGRVGEFTSFTNPSLKTGTDAADAALMGNELADLEPSRWYKSLEITGETKVGDEPAYVLRKTPLMGKQAITDYLSKSSFRLLRRQIGPLQTVDYSDYREVDGLTLPFVSTASSPDGAKTVSTITSVKFDERVPEWLFKAPRG